jgi:hypothetical protein
VADHTRKSTGLVVACAALGSIAGVLRIYGASGDLWLDEIWSVKLAGLLRHGQFLVEGLALDNNHYLNTLYLMLAGPDASPLTLRALSILLGAATVPVAGYAMRRFGIVAMMGAAAAFAAAYLFVNYGSEARGYAGLILATLLALIMTERALETPDRRATTGLAIAGIFGFLFQPIMLLTLALLGLWIVWQLWQSTRDIRQVLRRTWTIFMPTAAGLLPLLVIIAGAALRSQQYLIAVATPFSLANFLEGYAGLFRALLGIPDGVPDLPILIAPVAVLLALRTAGGSPRLSLGVIALVLLPLIVLIARPPNVQFPRYYLASGTIFVLLLAELFAIAWRCGAAWRGLAAILALAIVTGNVLDLAKLFCFDRGDPLPAMQQIADAGQPVVLNTRDKVVVEYLAERHGVPIATVMLTELCTAHPAFALISDPDASETLTLAQPGCTVAFRRVMSAPFRGLSGSPWTLYRAE